MVHTFFRSNPKKRIKFVLQALVSAPNSPRKAPSWSLLTLELHIYIQFPNFWFIETLITEMITLWPPDHGLVVIMEQRFMERVHEMLIMSTLGTL